MTSLGATDAPDEIALPAFEDVLWAALRAEHAHQGAEAGTPSSAPPADGVGDDGWLPLEGDGRSRRRWALVAATVVVVTGIGLALAGGEDRAPSTIAGPSALVVPPSTPEEAVAAALAAAADVRVVVWERELDGRPVQRSWGDDESGFRRVLQYDEDGRPSFDLGPAVPPDALSPEAITDMPSQAVDHCVRQFTQTQQGARLGGVLRELAHDVEEGRMVLDGTEVVEGRELLVLRLRIDVNPYEPPPAEPPSGSVPVDETQATYLDPETLLPVMARHEIGSAIEDITRYRILPRDPANLGLLVPDVPEGFTRVDTLPTDEERAALGCT